jgi:hypothetical protein
VEELDVDPNKTVQPITQKFASKPDGLRNSAYKYRIDQHITGNLLI